MGLFKRSTKGQSASRRGAKPPQPKTFILEPILTPSGLVTGEDPDHPAALVDLVTHPAVDLGMTPTEMHPVIDSTDAEGDRVHPVEDLALQSSVSDAIAIPHTDIQPLAFVGHPIDSLPNAPVSPFTSGVFTVGESGLVSVDYLFDGGGYKGELAFFSLEGMEQFTPGSEEFIQEAAHRALSNSDLGHVIVRDAEEGAKFSARLGYEGNFNRGSYLGEKTIHMTAGSKFGVMLVPNGTVQEVYENPAIESSKRPLFSLATANPQDKMHLGQIGDVTGDGHTFSLEDKRLDKGSDRDYNDVVFHVKGATGQAESLDSLINPQKDWRQSAIGHQLIEYVTQLDATPEPGTGGEVPPDSGQGSGEGTPAGEGTGNGGSSSNGGSPTPSDPDPGNSGQPTTGTENSGGSGTGTSSGSGTSSDPVTPPTTETTPTPTIPLSQQPLVGIIDTGFAPNNPDIDYTNILLGRDYVGDDANPLLATGEGSQHGTHILGVIKAAQGNGLGIDGINDDAKVWVSRATGSGKWADALKEFVDTAKALGQPHAIANLSFDLTQVDAQGFVSTRYEFTPQEREVIEYARQNNVLIVAAAGNDGGVMSVLGQASKEFDNILTVGAADGMQRANYSSYGEGLDILAPGGTIDRPVASTVGTGLGTLAGTSVATAQVTGVVSLVWATNPGLSYTQVIDILKTTATDLNQPGWDVETGAGLLNQTEAIKLAKSLPSQPYVPVKWVAPLEWSGDSLYVPLERSTGEVTLTAETLRDHYKSKYYVLSYLPNGFIHSATDSLGQTTRFLYDSSNKLDRITYPSGVFKAYAYDAQGAIASVDTFDSWGRKITPGYDILDPIAPPPQEGQPGVPQGIGTFVKTEVTGSQIQHTYTKGYVVSGSGGAIWAVDQRDSNNSGVYTVSTANGLTQTIFTEGRMVRDEEYDVRGFKRSVNVRDGSGDTSFYYDRQGILLATLDDQSRPGEPSSPAVITFPDNTPGVDSDNRKLVMSQLTLPPDAGAFRNVGVPQVFTLSGLHLVLQYDKGHAFLYEDGRIRWVYSLTGQALEITPPGSNPNTQPTDGSTASGEQPTQPGNGQPSGSGQTDGSGSTSTLPVAPLPGQGNVPQTSGSWVKTTVSNEVATHYYTGGYLECVCK
jgi:hypothetical protein